MGTRKPVQIMPAHVESYERKVVRRGADACWGWTGMVTRLGYAVVAGWDRVNHAKISNAQAHRVSYFIEHGALPAGLDIMHLCHNPTCSNPRHLKPGTRGQNMQTSVSVGRCQRRIPIEDMPKIMLRRAMGHSLQTIANDYACTKQAVRHMILAHWDHI